MPQNSYTNADLARFSRTPARPDEMEVLSEVKNPQAPYVNEPSVEALLAEAHGALGRASNLEGRMEAEGVSPSAILQIPRRAENLKGSAGYDKVTPIDMMSHAGTALAAASPVVPPLAAIAGLLKAPKAAQTYLDTMDEEGGGLAAAAPEAIEATLYGASGPIGRGVGALARGGKNLVSSGLQALRQSRLDKAMGSFPARVLGGTASKEIPYKVGTQLAGREAGRGTVSAMQGPNSSVALRQLFESGGFSAERQAANAAAAANQAHNIARNAPYAYGGVIPGPKPTELLDEVAEGVVSRPSAPAQAPAAAAEIADDVPPPFDYNDFLAKLSQSAALGRQR